jgi:hypothetical protein
MNGPDTFPLEIKLGDLKGIISILKENEGSAPLSKLAEDSESEFEILFPLLEACRILGLVTVINGTATLTEAGNALNIKDFRKKIGQMLKGLEPFRSMLERLKKHHMTTEELFDFMLSQGLVTQINRETDIRKFRKEMIGLLIRTEMCSYDPDEDVWKPL